MHLKIGDNVLTLSDDLNHYLNKNLRVFLGADTQFDNTQNTF